MNLQVEGYSRIMMAQVRTASDVHGKEKVYGSIP
jgi:hypothetical protein